MMESVIGLLADRASAERVRGALLEAGCGQADVVIFDPETVGAVADTVPGITPDAVASVLVPRLAGLVGPVRR